MHRNSNPGFRDVLHGHPPTRERRSTEGGFAVKVSSLPFWSELESRWDSWNKDVVSGTTEGGREGGRVGVRTWVPVDPTRPGPGRSSLNCLNKSLCRRGVDRRICPLVETRVGSSIS